MPARGSNGTPGRGPDSIRASDTGCRFGRAAANPFADRWTLAAQCLPACDLGRALRSRKRSRRVREPLGLDLACGRARAAYGAIGLCRDRVRRLRSVADCPRLAHVPAKACPRLDRAPVRRQEHAPRHAHVPIHSSHFAHSPESGKAPNARIACLRIATSVWCSARMTGCRTMG